MPGNRKILSIDAAHPDPGAIRRAAEIVRAGGVVVYPTSLLYGLGADATRAAAVKRIFAIKQRIPEKPVSVLINRKEDLPGLVTGIPDAARSIMDRLWPGKVTLVFHASATLPGTLTANTGKIGIRLPLHPAARMLLETLAIPVTATSANISGDPGGWRIEEMPEAIIRAVDLVLDAGPLPGGPGSTVVDVTVDPPAILRQGAVSAADVRAACRSGSLRGSKS